MQHEITTAGPLLDGSGNLREPGYAKRLLPIYRRADIKAPASRIKEWDYYLIANDHFAVALTIDDNGYMGLDSISFLHFDQRWERTKSPMRAFPMGRTGLPESSASGTTATSGRGYALVFRHVPQGRELTFHMENFLNGQTIDGSVTLTEEPEESMVICTPFPKPGCFYYNQKINCMRARGQVRLGEKTYVFDPADSFGVLDWGRVCGRITTPGIGAAPPVWRTACPSAGTSATALAIPLPPARICCSTAARPTSSARCASTSPRGTGGTISCLPGASPPTTAGLR